MFGEWYLQTVGPLQRIHPRGAGALPAKYGIYMAGKNIVRHTCRSPSADSI